MKGFFKIAIYIVILLGLLKMYDSNPEKDDYIHWISEQATKETENILIKGIVSVIAEPVLDSATTQKDFLVFSIFETDLTGYGMEKIKVVGVLGQFLPISSTADEEE